MHRLAKPLCVQEQSGQARARATCTLSLPDKLPSSPAYRKQKGDYLSALRPSTNPSVPQLPDRTNTFPIRFTGGLDEAVMPTAVPEAQRVFGDVAHADQPPASAPAPASHLLTELTFTEQFYALLPLSKPNTGFFLFVFT